MRPKRRLHRILMTLQFMLVADLANAQWLHHGDCRSAVDPAVSDPGLFNICANGNAEAWFVHKSNRADQSQPDRLYNADGNITLFLTPWLSGNVRGHSRLYIDRETQNTTLKDTKRDSWHIQLGNNALSRHRLGVGHGKPLFRINHQLRKEIFYAWGLDLFESPEVDYITYVYDNQLDWTVNATYGRLPDKTLSDKQRLFVSGRIMYDVAALEGTRIVLGGYNDGLLNRAVSIGLININGRGEQTSIEVTRTFAKFPYDPDEFKQNIRISHLSREQDKTNIRFQYDDFFRLIRVGGLGVIYRPQPLLKIEFEVGFAKHEDIPKRSHWYIAGSSGVEL